MTNKLKYFIANWKMYGDLSSLKIVTSIDTFLLKNKKNFNIRVITCIPSTLIYHFSLKLKNSRVVIGAQNCHYEENSGSFTGSINTSMLKKIGAKYVLIGHSENRNENDSNKIIKKKIISALNKKLNVIFCIGETLQNKRKNETFKVLKKQINESLDKKFDFNKIIFAYEPIWSIGSGNIIKSTDLKKTVSYIKKYIIKKFKKNKFPKVLYGGSINSTNIKNFTKIPELDGFLVGGASRSSKKFIDIIRNYYK